MHDFLCESIVRDVDTPTYGHKTGPSTANTRIESFWRQGRRMRFEFWIEFFRDLVDNHFYNFEMDYEKKCCMFIFGPILQQECNNMLGEWNIHKIRPTPHTFFKEAQTPNFLYTTILINGE